MKHLSIKARITVLLTILMTVLAGLMLAFILVISRSVADKTVQEQLTDTVRNNLNHIEVLEGKPMLSEEFVFYHSGVSTLIYSKNETLLAGQIPVSFRAQVPFESGVLRRVQAQDTERADYGAESDVYLVLDMWLPTDWESGVWVRGLMEAPDNSRLTKNLLAIALATLPLFIFMAAFGSYLITKRSFQPLDTITATAEAINEAKDLSGRINLPPGKDEFSRLAGDFDDMFERLERSFEAEKQFTADASHELRTPVSVIKGACEYAQKYDETPEEFKETISMIHRQADKMAVLVSQLLSMTRMEQGTEKMHLEVLDLGETVRGLCRELKEGEGLPGICLEINAEKGISVQADKELLGRLLRNLVENAYKYGGRDAVIRVSVHREKEEALMSVSDEGIGISKDEQEKIWQRFYQVDSSRSESEGTGLGLSIVQQIARLHGGYMSLESETGKGSIFTLHLPMAEEIAI